MNKTIYLKPKFIESPVGRNQSVLVNGKKEGTTKARGASFTYRFRDHATKRHLACGLDEMIDNPWYVKDADETKINQLDIDNIWIKEESIWKYPKIKKQTYYEIKHRREPGFYDYSSFYARSSKEMGKPRTYLQDLKFIIEDRTNVIDLSIPDNELFFEAMQVDPLFEMSYDDAMRSATARFYVSYKEQDEESLTSTYTLHRQAVVKVNDVIEKNTQAVIDFCILLKIVKGDASIETASNRLYEWVDSSEKVANKSRSTRIAEFNAYYDLFNSKTKLDKLEFNNSVFLQKLINQNVVGVYREVYTWYSQKGTSLETLGRNKREVLKFLGEPANADYYVQLENELKVRS